MQHLRCCCHTCVMCIVCRKSHADALFHAKGCLRGDDPLYGPCLTPDSQFYEVCDGDTG